MVRDEQGGLGQGELPVADRAEGSVLELQLRAWGCPESSCGTQRCISAPPGRAEPPQQPSPCRHSTTRAEPIWPWILILACVFTFLPLWAA